MNRINKQNTFQTNAHKVSSNSSSYNVLVAISWLAVAVMAGVIFWMSANTGTNINEGLGIISTLKEALTSATQAIFGHKVDVSPVGHFTEYFIFGALLFNALRFHMPLSHALLFAILIGSAYGITDEFHQYFVPERSCDPMDWLIDTIAATIGAMVCRLAIESQLSKHPKN